MIIGNGMIAKAFKEFKNNSSEYIIFASGVSSSKTEDKQEFIREQQLLEMTLDKYQDKFFIYFSSCSLLNEKLKNDKYHQHKLNMENIIKKKISKYLICRLPNVVGKDNNKNTLIAYLVKNILNNRPINVWSGAVRNIIDIDDVVKIVFYIIENNIFVNQTVHIANKSNISIFDLINKLSIYLKRDVNIITIQTEIETLTIPKDISEISDKLLIRFDNNYINTIITKYY